MRGARLLSLLAPLALVVLYGALLGHIAWTTLFGYAPQAHVPTWTAPWIVLPGGTISQTYYRKKIYISEAPRRASLKIIAPDAYTIYLNGEPVGNALSLFRNVTGVYDITSRLEIGTNVLAVLTTRRTYPGTARIAVEGEYEDWHGTRVPIVSDATWKVAPYRQRQPDAGPLWLDRHFDDTNWEKAKTDGTPGPDDHGTVLFPPWIFTGTLDGYWVWPQEATADKGYFRHTLDLPSGPRDAWLRVATSAGFSLVVNGVPIAEQEGPSQEALPSQPLRVHIYDVTPYLRRGPNSIALKAYTKRTDRRVYADGLIVERSGKEHLLGTSSAWRSSAVPPPGWAERAYDDSGWAPSVALGRITPKDGQLTHRIEVPYPPISYRAKVLALWIGALALGALVAIVLWRLGAAARVRRWRGELDEALSGQSPAFAVAAAALIGVLLARYDFRIDPAFPYRPGVILAGLGVLFALQALLIFWRPSAPEEDRAHDEGEPSAPRWWMRAASAVASRRWAVVVGLLMILGLCVRLIDVDYEPLGPDESTAILSVQGILKTGYPNYRISNLMEGRESHSSELVGYPKALAVLFLGPTEFAARLPSVLFGTLTILMIFVLGRALFDARIAALSALIFALLPAAISFTHYSRYPSQLAFFTLVTVYLFYRAIASERVNIRILYVGVVLFAVTFLSWEGVAFLLPGLVFGIFAYKWPSFRWLGEKHLWFAMGLVTLVIFFQQAARIANQADRMVLGSGLTDITVVPLWLQPEYDALVYLKTFLFTKNLEVVAGAMLVGMLLCWWDRRFAFLNVVILTPLFLTTNLLEAHEFRQVYYTLPLVILSGTKAIFLAFDRLLPVRVPSREGAVVGVRIAARVCLVCLLLLTVNDYVFKLYNMPGYTNPTTWLGVGDDGTMKDAAKFVRRHMSPGEPVIARQPTWTYWYLKQVDFLIKADNDIPAAVADALPVPVHRKSGVMLIPSEYAVQQVLNNVPSAWIIANNNLGGFDEISFDFVNSKLKLVYEDRGVGVYRWER
jgi:4-amino-4-deoxy-L-arabinose transferase-like glycosyltransferase